MKMINNRKNEKGFTLIELMLVVAIIAILSGIVMIPLSGYRKRAADTKALAELSATIQPMLTCRSDGGLVYRALGNGGNNICTLGDAYGKWPSYNYSSNGTEPPTSDSSFNDATWNNWYFFTDDGNRRICCNKISMKCVIMDKTDSCNKDTEL